MDTDPTDPANRWLNQPNVQGDAYDSRYREAERAGENVHGEADFVESFHPTSVLDAGCGTGRVGIELARRGIEVVGVDIDPRLLNTARKKAPQIAWHLADLSKFDLHRRLDLIVMAGNVMIFLAPGTEGTVLRNLARHLAPGGHIVAGFQLSIGYLSLADYDRLASEARLELVERYSTWDRAPWSPADNYAVSVHRHARG
ncbi:MAG: class I SAM-dependent methyltransferase [Chloroflexia bacterium]